MTVRFYSMNNPKNKINKTLSNPLVKENVYFKDKDIKTSVPFLKLHNFNYENYNYCYIVELDKYYFFDSVIIENASIISINLEIDVLMTYKNIISNTTLNIIECNKDYVNTEKATAEKKDNIILSKIDIDVADFFNNDTIVMVVHK